MNLIDIIETSFENVMQQYIEDNGSKNDCWEVRNLERANDKFGKWIMAKIKSSEIGEIVLPYYSYGGIPITPKEGAFLSDAYDNFKKNKERFRLGNKQFCDRIDAQKRLISLSGIRSIFLSQEPLFIGDSYSGLEKYKNKITHLDGFHRLMALMDMEQKPEFIQSYIAVYSTFLDSLNYGNPF